MYGLAIFFIPIGVGAQRTISRTFILYHFFSLYISYYFTFIYGELVDSYFSYSSDGNLVEAGLKDRTIRIWNVRTFEEAYEPLKGYSGHVYCVAFPPDNLTATLTFVQRRAKRVYVAACCPAAVDFCLCGK